MQQIDFQLLCVCVCVFQAYLQCASWYLDASMKQQAGELSVKTEDHLTNAPVTLEDSQLCPGKNLKDHSTKRNDSSFQSGNCVFCVLNILSHFQTLQNNMFYTYNTLNCP